MGTTSPSSSGSATAIAHHRHYFHLPLLLILISWSTQVIFGQVQPPTTQKVLCRFRNKEYAPGDVWYPSASSPYCVSCTCLTSGRQNCTRQECPRDCNTERSTDLQHPCCKVCEERESDSSQSGQGGGGGQFGQVTAESGEEDEEDGDLVTENSEFVSCLHQGRIFRDGESFTANVTGLPIHAFDQCMQCVCQTGMVLCQMKSCSSFKCVRNGSGLSTFSGFTVPGSGDVTNQASNDACCQRCAAWKKPQPEKSSSSSSSSSRNLQAVEDEKQGTSSTSSFSNIIPNSRGSHGTNSFDRSITFRDGGGGRVAAPGSPNSKTKNTENNEVKEQAKTNQFDDCISSGRYYMHGSTWHPVMGAFGAMECVLCKCNRGQIDCGRLQCPLSKDEMSCKKVKVEGHCCPICLSMLNNDGSNMCVSNRQDITAQRSTGVGVNGTEYISFAFVKQQRRNALPQVDLHEWFVKDGEILQFSTKYISIADFNEIKVRQVFTLLGATNEKNLEKFTRREKKLEKRCVVRCSPRISSLERSLRIHRLLARKQCFSNERTVNI